VGSIQAHELLARRGVNGSVHARAGAAFACVLGDLDLIRPLALARIPCAVVAPTGSVVNRSRFAHAVIAAGCDAISEDPGDLPEQLLRFASAQKNPPVLFYQEDEQLLFVSRCRDRLAAGFRFVVPAAELVEDLVDKARFQLLAERLRLPVPATRQIRPAAGSRPADVDLQFPVVAKPLRRRRSWSDIGYRAKAVRVDTPEALGFWWPRWTHQGVDLLVQELVPGPETTIESYHVYVDAQGQIVAEFTGRKIRTLPPEFGFSTALAITDAADVAALGQSLVHSLGLRGVAKFDFKRAPDGRLYLLEVNPRFNLWHHLGAVAGVNLPALVYGDMVGVPRRATMPKARAGVTWCRLADDWRAAKACGIPLRSWSMWALGCEAKSMAWDDPVPFLHTAWRLVSHGVRSVLHPARVPGT
jgi:predicted ATP-grasp superfamily ATP-dependent carboligase